MANDTATLVLDGPGFPIQLYASALGEFSGLIEDLNTDYARDAGLPWMLAESNGHEREGDGRVHRAIVSTRAEYETDAGEHAAEAVVAAYEELGTALEVGQGLNAFSDRVAKHGRELRGMLNGHIRTMVFSTAESEAAIVSDSSPNLLIPTKRVSAVSLGSVRGRIEMMGRRQGVRFTIYGYNDDLPVNCFLGTDNQDALSEQLRSGWGKVAIVSGLLRRDPETDRPMSIRQVSHIDIVEERGDTWDFRKAKGAWPWKPGDPTAAQSIRMVRDA
jgi:hypothetical protein